MSAEVKEKSNDDIIHDLGVDIGNEVYKACLVYEVAENKGLLQGNGHHMAQNIALLAKVYLLNRYYRGKEISEQEKQSLEGDYTNAIKFLSELKAGINHHCGELDIELPPPF